MSKYTTEVRFICETYAGLQESEGYDKINEIIEKARPQIFDFDYPIFDPNYKRGLETKILHHYYTREIGCETVGLWKHMLATRMNEIMPYMNQLYESELLAFNPFYNLDYTRSYNRDTTESNENKSNMQNNVTTDGTQTKTGTETVTVDNEGHDTGTIGDVGTSSNTRTLNTRKDTDQSGSDGEQNTDAVKNTRWDIYSDTPQGALTNVENETYLTNARKITDDGTGSTRNKTTTYGKSVDETETGTIGDSGNSSNTKTLNTTSTVDGEQVTEFDTRLKDDRNVETTQHTNGTNDSSGLEHYLEEMKGKNSAASFSKLLMEFRETFLNIDMMVIDRLADLFFLLW